MTSNDGQPGYLGDLSRNAVTLAEVMKSTGYRTYMSGEIKQYKGKFTDDAKKAHSAMSEQGKPKIPLVSLK